MKLKPTAYGLLTTLCVACAPAAEHDAAMLRHHCEMVELYRASAGEYGWPDYNNTATQCDTAPAPKVQPATPVGDRP